MAFLYDCWGWKKQTAVLWCGLQPPPGGSPPCPTELPPQPGAAQPRPQRRQHSAGGSVGTASDRDGAARGQGDTGTVLKPLSCSSALVGSFASMSRGTPRYKEHSTRMGEASLGRGLLKTEIQVWPGCRAGCQKQGWVLAGRVRSPLQAAFSGTGQISSGQRPTSHPCGAPSGAEPLSAPAPSVVTYCFRRANGVQSE